MNRTSRVVVALLLLAVGVALIVYRVQAAGQLAEPLPILITVVGVAAVLGGFGVLGGGRKGADAR